MSFEYIRNSYNVPAKKGGRVLYKYKNKLGTIVSARGSYLRIILDGETLPYSYHPTWEIEYLETPSKIICPWCNESPLTIYEHSERGNNQAYSHGFYAGCKDFMLNCPDTTGIYPTFEEALVGAKEAVFEQRGHLNDPR